jgi:deoxycytidine triphosphate deaminase
MANRRTLPKDIGYAAALLTDEGFRQAHKEQNIFASEADYKESNVRQASYELTLQEVRELRFEQLKKVDGLGDPLALEVSAFKVTEGDQQYVIINPWQCCQLMVHEQIVLPDNVVGHVMARGQLFQSGLIVESTYVDPGFGPVDGKSIHLMAFNATQRQVKLPIGVPIARLEVIRLEKDVTDPHGGRSSIKTPEMSPQSWPWPVSLNDHGAEVAAARLLRDKDLRLLAMDRMTIAIEGLVKRHMSQEHWAAGFRIYTFITAPLFIWLILTALNLRNFLNAASQASYDKLYQSIPIWVPMIILLAAWAGMLIGLRRDLGVAFGSLFQGDGK